MNKLNGFEFRNYYSVIRTSWNNLNEKLEKLLDLSFIIDDSESIWNEFNITINSKGEVIQCSSLMSTTDNIDYYISMGENLKRIKSFCENKGKELFAEVENIVNKSNKLYDNEKIQIEKLKEEYDYNNLCNSHIHLIDTIKAFEKRKKLSRKKDKIEELTNQIEGIKIVIGELKNKLHEYQIEENKIMKKTRIKEKEIREEKYKALKRLEKEYNKYL